MLSTTNLAIQLETKPLFEHVTVKFGDRNRYGLIGANGCGKSTLMKILGGELEPTAGDVILGPGIEEWRHNQLMREVPPGLKLRVLLAQALFSRPDVLLLDEPTNHMDMESIESLQIGLEKYPGTLIFVSHDREFVGALANRVIELKPGGGVVDFKGSYDEYLEACGLPA